MPRASIFTRTGTLVTDASKAEKAKGPSFPVDTGNGKGPSILDEHLLAMVLDPSGGVFHFNQACQGLTGYTSEEVAGKRPWDFLSSGEESRREEASFKKAMNNAGDQGFEAYWTAKSGARRRIAWSSQAIGNSSASKPSARFLCVGIPLPLQENPDVRLRDSEARMAGIIATAAETSMPGTSRPSGTRSASTLIPTVPTNAPKL